MTDFESLKSAAEEIKLDDLQKQRILNACKNQKKKRINPRVLTAVAAVFIVATVLFSPTIFHILNPAKSDSNMAEIVADEDSFGMDDGYKYHADENGEPEEERAQSVTGLNYVVFKAEKFRSIYSVIPEPFYEIVDYKSFIEWSQTAKAENGMAIVQFVEYFGITREQFEAANQRYSEMIHEIYGVDSVTGAGESELIWELEIFNTDVVYSFNREKINEYYSVK